MAKIKPRIKHFTKQVPLFQLALVIVLATGLIITLSLTQSSSAFAASCSQGDWKCDGNQALRCYKGQWLFQFGCTASQKCTLSGSIPHCSKI